MNPTIKKLPKSVQSLICASNQINCYTKAVKELVFNALDADASSIAVRINIAEGSLQVIDNGCGISQADFKYIGQNYMTSKLVDISMLKSAPNKYGYQGRSLANLTQISETLKVTSRFWKCDTTYVKTFENGKAYSTAKSSSRPSKGTTVEIKGFLYNLNIQKKSVNSLCELQRIKTFLEHISLVHSSISLSLRDDSKNDIVYKIHKNRDIYQTLSALYEIEKTNVQELHVEKNQYKVKAYVGKRDVETTNHLIFLNGKCVNDSSLLHKKVNENFKKHLKGGKQTIKKNTNNDGESHIFGSKIPFYFIFITCPYMDYELTNMILEFKDWRQINMILDKLVKFYIGDIKLQVIPNKQTARFIRKYENDITKNQIEKIMQQILGNHGKKPAISQMQNGIKGKLIKRKHKSKLSRIDPKKSNNQQELSKHGSNEALVGEHNNNNNKTNSDVKLRSKSENVKKRKENKYATVSTKTSAKRIIKSKTIRKPNSKVSTQKKQFSRNNDNITNNKRNDKQCFKKVSLNNKFAMETDSVKKRCKLLARQTKKLIENNERNIKVFINENVQTTNSKFVNSNTNIHTNVHKKISEIVIHEYIPKSKFNPNKNIVENNKNKLFKTNYDLLQTILSSQRENNKFKKCINSQKDYIPKFNDRLSPFEAIASDYNRVPLVSELNCSTLNQSATSGHNIFRESDKNMLSCEKIIPDDNLRPSSRDIFPFQVAKASNRIQSKELFDYNIPIRDYFDHSSLRSVDEKSNVNSSLRSVTLDSNIRTSDNKSPFQIVTFQSHHYNEQDIQTDTNIEMYNLPKRAKKFITTQSRQNFTLFPANNQFRRNKTNLYLKLFQANNHKRKLNKSIKIFDMKNNTDKGIRESYTIEFTESNKYNYTPMLDNYSKLDNLISINKTNSGVNESITPSMSYIFNDPCYQCESPVNFKTWLTSKNGNGKDKDLDYEPIIENTYPITSSYNHNYINISLNHENNNETYTIQNTSKSCYENEGSEMICNTDKTASDYNVFVSKSQEYNDERLITNPIDVCETVLEDKGLSMNVIREFNMSFESKQDSCEQVDSNDANKMQSPLNAKNITPSSGFREQNEVNAQIKSQNLDEVQEVSHHFTLYNNKLSMQQSSIQNLNKSSISKSQYNAKNITSKKPDGQNKNATILDVHINEKNDTGAFNMRNRMFFIPKGMSPIFEEYQTKVYEHDPTEDYYADKIYNDFVDKVQNDTEIFKPKIRDTSDTTKVISRVNNKLSKEHASLKFDGICIKNANVLGQVDSKFIAATMKSKSNKSHDVEEFLVLFDQHAIHERIRLETNMADYLTNSQWTSVTIDEVPLKMSKDEILYLHNYRDKFTQFGLEWNILNYTEISINAIPKGILGKNPRQVDKIIKAVKNLITEEINMIQTQRGCVSTYPKSIMDLIFSEACRYAIKFGDHLSKSQCVELLNGLSDCKTPFQCAHGRPAMAVIMNIESNQHRYKINFNKIKAFKKIKKVV